MLDVKQAVFILMIVKKWVAVKASKDEDINSITVITFHGYSLWVGVNYVQDQGLCSISFIICKVYNSFVFY